MSATGQNALGVDNFLNGHLDLAPGPVLADLHQLQMSQRRPPTPSKTSSAASSDPTFHNSRWPFTGNSTPTSFHSWTPNQGALAMTQIQAMPRRQ